MLLFADSFDHYNTSQINRKWTLVVGNNITIGAVGRNGTNGMAVYGQNSAQIAAILPAQPSTLYIGGAVKLALTSEGATIFRVYDLTTEHVNIRLNVDGSITANWQGGSASSAAGAVPAFTTQANYIELGVVIHDTTGSMVVKVNGTTVLNLTNKDTKGSANAYATRVAIQPLCGDGQGVLLDDFYVCDNTGTEANNFLGDIRIEYRTTTGAGATTNLTPSTGSNYQNVDDNPANDETDYNSSSNPGDKDTYAMQDLVSTAGAVVAVAVVSTDRKDDAGTRTHSHRVRLSGTESVSAAFSPTTSYVVHQTFFTVKPGGGAWTITDVNNIEAGMELTT